MPNNDKVPDAWSVTCHVSLGSEGRLLTLRHDRDGDRVTAVDAAPPDEREEAQRPILIGGDDRGVWLLDPVSRTVRGHERLPINVFPAYAYKDPVTRTYWMVSDGDKHTGVDSLHCGNSGSTVTVIQDEGSRDPQLLDMVCLGRGHHVVSFTAPTAQAPQMPPRAYVSNLMDGSLSVLNNDPAQDTYLEVATVINLCDLRHEDGKGNSLPNNAYPHGLVFSTTTSMVYNLNNGYSTVVAIDPLTNTIEYSAAMKHSSNLLLSPCGRYLIGKGVNRKVDPEHLMGKLSVMEAATGQIVSHLDLPDVYPSVYRFNPEGSRLYVTTAATGQGKQKEHAKLDRLLVFDAGALPRLVLLKEVKVGRADCGRRPIAFHSAGASGQVFVPNPTDGTLSVLDAQSSEVRKTITLSEPPISDVNFSFWNTDIHGA